MAECRHEFKAEAASPKGEIAQAVNRLCWHIWLVGACLFATMVGLRLFD